MSIAVVGSRDFNDYNLMCKVLNTIYGTESIVSGGAIGADTLSATWARAHNYSVFEIIPNYKKYGGRAPLIRNKEIIAQSDWVVAFWDGRLPGTKNSIMHARNMMKPLTIILYNSL